jgi:hypothetical protein
MLKFPYGLGDFYQLITEHYFYVDRTAAIPQLEDAGKQLLFLRPRRFGKSLLLSMLENYYDVAKAGEFEKLFGHLAIGANPTAKHNQYFVLKWDFSAVSPQGEVMDIQQSLYNHINGCIEQFKGHYRHLLDYDIMLDPTDAIRSFQSVLAAVSQTPYRLYLLIDEYDNFANEVLMSSHSLDPARYQALLSGEGILKTLFKAVKSASSGNGLERVFITGVSPLVLSDMTSGYNVAKNIYLEPEFNDLCGFLEAELQDVLSYLAKECQWPPETAREALSTMRTFYNGYCFSPENDTLVYNSTAAIYFLEHLQKRCQPPSQMLDRNLAMDRNKLVYIAKLPQGFELIVQALCEQTPLSLSQLADRFEITELLSTTDQNLTFMMSLLYYFGILTFAGHTQMGKLRLTIPNLVVKTLYVERLQEWLLPDSRSQQQMIQVVEHFYQTGDLQGVCDLVEQRLTVLDNRDYRSASELVLKMAFVSVLFDDTLYSLVSEPPLARRYADLALLVRPDKRQYPLLDFLFEFKYLSFAEVGLGGKKRKRLTAAQLKALPKVQEQLSQAKIQLQDYRQTLETTTTQKLRLRVYAVVGVGFERVVWQEL